MKVNSFRPFFFFFFFSLRGYKFFHQTEEHTIDFICSLRYNWIQNISIDIHHGRTKPFPCSVKVNSDLHKGYVIRLHTYDLFEILSNQCFCTYSLFLSNSTAVLLLSSHFYYFILPYRLYRVTSDNHKML